MMMPFILASAFFIGFIIESMVGLGGTLVAYSILLFFFDVKSLIISTIILPVIASFAILSSDIKSIPLKVVLKNAFICILGVPIGFVLFNYLSGDLILRFLAIFLILFGIRSVFLGEVTINGVLGKLIVFISGIIHGIVGVAGPIAIIGMKDQFKNKSELRAGMAVFFIIINIFRVIQFMFTNPISSLFVNIWVIIPMLFGIALGTYLHKKVSEEVFKKILSIFFIVAGFLLLIK
jgi:uncharacterized membrane protein YfcA